MQKQERVKRHQEFTPQLLPRIRIGIAGKRIAVAPGHHIGDLYAVRSAGSDTS